MTTKIFVSQIDQTNPDGNTASVGGSASGQTGSVSQAGSGNITVSGLTAGFDRSCY